MTRKMFGVLFQTAIALMVFEQISFGQESAMLTRTEKGCQVKGSFYTAEVLENGSFQKLAVNGQDFLPVPEGGRMGGYLYQKGILKLSGVNISENTLTAGNEQTELTYAFAADSVTVSFVNKTDEVMTLVLLFVPEVNAATDGSNVFLKPPVNTHWPNSTWFRGNAKLDVKGGSRIWGPFAKDLQVWVLDVQGGKSGKAVLVPGIATDVEQAQAARATVQAKAPAPAKNETAEAARKSATVFTQELYTAAVAGDGSLTSLKVKGREFLHERGANPRGAYLYQGKAFGLTAIARPGSDKLTASGDKAEVTYTFAPEKISWQVRNLTDEKLTMLIAFAPGVEAVRYTSGLYEKAPFTIGAAETTWFQGDLKLDVSNGDRIWGPWSDEKLQIWQYDIGPKGEHITVFTPGMADADELSGVKTALSYVAEPPTDPTGPMWDLKKLSSPPEMCPAEGFKENGVDAIFYKGLPYRGRETQVFAWLGVPKTPDGKKVPGMVLIHGGGGTAFADWVRLWNSRGYAAIAMDTCGCVSGGEHGKRPRHAKGGPPGWGGYNQIDWPRTDQWAYHAIADVILANSLLRSLPEVDENRIGVTGISWGGYLCSMVAGVDDRFRFASPVYGCGFTTEHAFAGSVKGLGEERADRWMRWWDPSSYLANAKMPMFWVSGSNDFAYTLNALQKSYRLPQTPRTLCIRLRMPHGQGEGSAPKEIAAFADSILGNGTPLIRITGQGEENGVVWATFESESPVAKAELNVTRDTDRWQDRKWEMLPAQIQDGKVTADLPADATVYYLNLTDERGLLVSTEHIETGN